MEKLYKSRREACLWQVKEKFWNKSLPKQKKIVPGAVKGRCLSVPYPSPLSLRLMNNNFSSLISSQEGYLCRLRECTMFRRPSWHKRRFVLLEDKLYCYEKKEDVLVFSEIIMMSDVTSLTLQNSNCIKISQVDGSTRMLRFPSKDVRNSWLTALLAAKAANLLKYQ